MEHRSWNLKNGMYLNSSIAVKTAFSDIQQDDLYLVEDVSWWFEYRANIILKMLSCFFVKEKMLLDIGGGQRVYDFPDTGRGISSYIDRTDVGGM